MQLSEKAKTFSQYFTEFLESASNLKNKEKKKMKVTLVAYVFSILKTVKCLARQISEEPRFIWSSYCQHVEGSQTLVKSPWEYFYQIVLPLWEKLIQKTSVLVIFQLLLLFVKTFSAASKYFPCNV